MAVVISQWWPVLSPPTHAALSCYLPVLPCSVPYPCCPVVTCPCYLSCLLPMPPYLSHTQGHLHLTSQRQFIKADVLEALVSCPLSSDHLRMGTQGKLIVSTDSDEDSASVIYNVSTKRKQRHLQWHPIETFDHFELSMSKHYGYYSDNWGSHRGR